MALFGKNKYAMQKHSIIDVIKYEGSSDVLVWRYPTEDFNTNAQLIVGPSQEAVLVKGGHTIGRSRSDDVLVTRDGVEVFPAERIQTKNTHGTGCYQCSRYYQLLGFELMLRATRISNAVLQDNILSRHAY